jgi:hypothetical protein
MMFTCGQNHELQNAYFNFSAAQESYVARNPITDWFTQFRMLSGCAW